MCGAPGSLACWRWKIAIGPTSSTSRQIATAEASGQSALVKNSSHSTLPIISVSVPPSRSGITNSPTAGMKTSRQPATMPGSDSGRVTVRKAGERPGAEIGRRLEQAPVELLQRGVERQHHERQVGIDDAEMDRPFGAEDRAGIGDEAGPAQELVQDAVLRQQAHPGVDADQERGPERQHDQHQQQRPPPRRGAGDGVGHGIAQQQRDQGRGGGDAQGGDPGGEIEIVGEQQPEARRS